MERKLAAILNADVEGYSRLMGEDEAATVRTRAAYGEVIARLVSRHGGRVVDFTGDNLLAEFASVVDAVSGAVEVQRELAARNAALPDHRKMRFRIGINLGDVIVEDGRIYGDGVNVAARVQTLAEGGGIAISGTVYDQIENKLAVTCESLGEHAVKNIAKPVRVYRVLMEPGTAAVAKPARTGPRPRRRAALIGVAALLVAGALGLAIWRVSARPPTPPGLELPDKPSIAVLPFVNVGADPKQEHFSDGMTEEIITTLSKVSELFVIASNSVFTYKGKPVKVQQVSQDLGVRYVLEGSVRKDDPRIRVTAQLIDATTGHHIWAERYDREVKDVFAVQDDIADKIVTALRVKLTEGEQVRVRRRTTDNVQAWELVSQAVEHHLRVGRTDGRGQARSLYEQAIAMDPRFAAAYAALSFLHAQDVRYGFTSSPGQSLELAAELAQKALALDDSLPEGHASLAYVHLMRRQHAEAVAEAERAVALLPSGLHVTRVLAEVLRFSGRPGDSVELMKRTMRLSPMYPPVYVWLLGNSYQAAGRYAEALVTHRKFVDLAPDDASGHFGMALAYAGLNREAEARAAMAQALRLNPRIMTLERMAKILPYKDPADVERAVELARKAGLQ